MAEALIPAAFGAATGGVSTAVTAISAGSSVLSGLGSLAAGNAEAAQQLRRAQVAETQGLEKEASLRDELVSTLSTVAAIRGVNGVSQNSPTGQAIAGDIRRFSMQEIASNRTNTQGQIVGLQSASSAARLRGRIGLAGGLAKSAPSLLSLAQG